MLVLTRRESQQIQIGDSVRIHIVEIKGTRVRIGIEAPRDIRVARAEADDNDQRGDRAD